jgi:hypothetical protein
VINLEQAASLSDGGAKLLGRTNLLDIKAGVRQPLAHVAPVQANVVVLPELPLAIARGRDG